MLKLLSLPLNKLLALLWRGQVSNVSTKSMNMDIMTTINYGLINYGVNVLPKPLKGVIHVLSYLFGNLDLSAIVIVHRNTLFQLADVRLSVRATVSLVIHSTSSFFPFYFMFILCFYFIFIFILTYSFMWLHFYLSFGDKLFRKKSYT